MQALRSLLYVIGMLPLIVLAVLGMFVVMLHPKWFDKVQDIWARAGMAWLKFSCGLGYEVSGAVPKSACIIFSKHQSAWETIALHDIFDHPLSWVLKKGLLWVPVFGWGIAMTRPIAIDRRAGKKAVEQIKVGGKQRLDEGSKVVIFPEGTRIAPGKMGRFKMGGSLLAAYSEYPVVPVAHNAGEFWPKRGFTKKAGTIQVKIGQPIETKGKTAEAINAEVLAWMEQAMQEISDA